MDYKIYENDLDTSWLYSKVVSIDTETTGANLLRDRLCLFQIMNEEKKIGVVQFNSYNASPNIKKILKNNGILKIFHFARFDVGFLYKTFKTFTTNFVCTKIISRITRTYTSKHGLKDLCKELLSVDLDKGEQCSYWGDKNLRESQFKYAINDVLYLDAIYKILMEMCEKEGKTQIINNIFQNMQYLIKLDFFGLNPTDFLYYQNQIREK